MPDAIQDELLRGKAPVPFDLADLLALLSHPRVGEALGGRRSETAVRQTMTSWCHFWAERGFGPWLFRHRETGAFVGYAGLAPTPRSIEPGSVELLYALRPEFWGRGFATRMSSLSLEHAFSQRDLSEVVAYTLTANRPSQRVLEKLGFSFERGFEHAGLPHLFYRLCRSAGTAVPQLHEHTA
jgi:RimJ/RimL family protein N-acetyltransferase